LAYAKREFTTGDAKLVVYPKKESFLEKLTEASQTQGMAAVANTFFDWMETHPSEDYKNLGTQSIIDHLAEHLLRVIQDPVASGKLAGGVLLVADENAAIRLLLQDSGFDSTAFSDSFWND
jgi:hypothetical protein